LSASRPFSAAQVLSATTVTPPSGMNLAGMAVPAMGTTFTTPGTAMAADSSHFTALPPSTAGRATTAYFMPSTRASCAYLAVPMVMSRRSVIWTFPLPM
jgi:hypothetical protein